MSEDPRRNLPRTDDLLASDWVRAASSHLNAPTTRAIVRAHLDRARTRGSFTAESFRADLENELERLNSGVYRRVLNATGVVIHTNLGRAPLSEWATQVARHTDAYTDIEMDVESGKRSRRGVETTRALTLLVPQAEDALVVNNCASVLMLIAAASVGRGRILLSRGEFVEIGAGFRLHELMRSVGADIAEVGATNRTHATDYRRELEDGEVAAILKIHPSNYRQSGFTSSPATEELAQLAREFNVPLIVDIGSGLLHPHPALPTEPDATTELTAGADLVLFSGDKLLGGPQAGIALGSHSLIHRLATHPLARAVRASKFVLATLAATVTGPTPPVHTYLTVSPNELRTRTQALADHVNAHTSCDARVVEHDGRVGGGGGTGVELPGFALELPESFAHPLRTGTPSVIPLIRDGKCLVDLRCVDPGDDHVVGARIVECAQALARQAGL